MIIEALNHWLDEALKHLEVTTTLQQEGYREAILHVKEFIAQEVELMDYEANMDN